ncbi:MAG: phage tail tape measure protein [Fimbriimonas sp.]
MEVAELEVLLGARMDLLQKDMAKATKILENFESDADKSAKGAEDKVTKRLKGMSAKAGAVGNAMSLALTAPLIGMGTVAARTFGEYESALATMRSVTKATGAEMKRAAELAEKLGNDIEIPNASAKDAAVTMMTLSKANFSVQESMDAARGALQLAAVAQIDAAQAAEINASALKSFELEASKSGKVADLLASAADSSLGSTTDMAGALSQASAVAHQFGVTIEDTVASLTLFSNAGIQGSDAGTSFKVMLTSLFAPTETGAKALKALGVSAFDSQQRMRSYEDVIGDLKEALDGLTEQNRAQKMKDIFGTDAIRVANVAVQQGTEGLRKMRDSQGEVGAAARAAAGRMGEQEKATKALQNAMETAMIKGGEPLSKVIITVAKVATQATEAFTGLPPELQETTIKAGLLVVALGPGIKGVTGVLNMVIGTRSAFLAASAARVAAMEAESAAALTAAGNVGKFRGALTLLGGVTLGGGAAIAGGYAIKAFGDDFVGGLKQEIDRDAEAFRKAKEHAEYLAAKMVRAHGEPHARKVAGTPGAGFNLQELEAALATIRRGPDNGGAHLYGNITRKGTLGVKPFNPFLTPLVDVQKDKKPRLTEAQRDQQAQAESLRHTIQRLNEEIALNGKQSDAASLRYQIQNGLIDKANLGLAREALALTSKKEAQESARESAQKYGSAMEDLYRRSLAVGAETDKDRIAIERFGKAFDKLTSKENRRIVESEARILTMEREGAAADRLQDRLRALKVEAAESLDPKGQRMAEWLGLSLADMRLADEALLKKLQAERIKAAFANGEVGIPLRAPSGNRRHRAADDLVAAPAKAREFSYSDLMATSPYGATIVGALAAANLAMERMATGRKDFDADMRSISDRLSLVTGQTTEYALRLRDLTAKYGDAKLAKQALDLELKTEHAERWAETMRSASQSVADSLADMLASGRVSIGGLQDLLGNLAYTVGRDYLGDWLGGAMKIRSGGTKASNDFAWLGGLVNFGRRETGGPVEAGHPYIVGEKRPEVFVPDESGYILPRVPKAAAAGVGGQVFNVNVTVNTPDMQTARASKAQIAAEIGQEIMSQIRRVM